MVNCHDFMNRWKTLFMKHKKNETITYQALKTWDNFGAQLTKVDSNVKLTLL